MTSSAFRFGTRSILCTAVAAAALGCGGARQTTPYYTAVPPQPAAPTTVVRAAPPPPPANPARPPTVTNLFEAISALAVAVPVVVAPFAVGQSTTPAAQPPTAPVTLASARSSAPVPCPRFEVAPGVVFAPDCGALEKAPFFSSSSVPFKRSLEGGSVPASIDLRTSGLDGPVKDQAQVGICFAFALSTLIENGLRRQGRADVIAPLHVLSSDAWDNLYAGRTSKALTTEPSWPYVPAKGCKLNENRSERWCEREYGVDAGSWRSDPVLVAEVERANRIGFARALRAEKLRKPIDPDQVARILATGQSMYASLALDMDAWGHKRQGGPEIPDWSRRETNHAVVIVGYRPGANGRQFLIHNSWSKKWRDGGYAWISEEMIRRHTNDAFTVEVEASGTPTPIPPILELPDIARLPEIFRIPVPGGGVPTLPSLPGLPSIVKQVPVVPPPGVPVSPPMSPGR